MNVLMVDDQPEVLAGVQLGVRWELLDVEERFTANDIFQAQEIIRTKRVDLLLCDIEMPFGSGLDLYQWVLENHYKIKCIFLTAHSDFSYMQSAIQMQGFDYLLQPASYEQIENSIRKAIDKIKLETVIDNYYEYGIALKKQEKDTTESVLRNYLLKCDDGRAMRRYFQAISTPLPDSAEFDCLLLQVMHWNNDIAWQPHLFQYAVGNVLQELHPNGNPQLFVITLHAQMYFVMSRVSGDAHAEDLRQCTEEFLELCPQHLGCRVAAYQGATASLEQLPAALEQLQELCHHNVLGESRFFTGEELREEATHYSPPEFDNWDTLETAGLYTPLRQEMLHYLDAQAQSGNMAIGCLRQFHQDVIYWFAHALGRHSIRAHEVFNQREDSEYNYDAMMRSYSSVERMKSLLNFICDCLESESGEKNTSSSSHMERIEEYICQNIQKSITRKELADAVYLNPEYLSRLFKKEKGCTLLEFITHKKMQLARSLLETTNFPVSMIASKVGYGNFSHFAQTFKKEFGVTPSDIRQSHK